MTKGPRDLALGRQLARAQCHGHESQRMRIIQSHTIENLMPAKDDAIASDIVEPETRIKMRACVAGGGIRNSA